MASITITDESLASVKDHVVIISGASSGIGLATARLLLSLGAKVSNGDISSPPENLQQNENVMFTPVDVTKYKDLCRLFRQTKEKFGRIDHVFCNAGISTRANYVDDRVDEDGDPVEPSRLTYEINVMGVVNMTRLAIWYLKKQESGGSIVLTSSASAFQRLSVVDYTTSKHAVLGFLRGLSQHRLYPNLPIRINALAPAYTDTPIVSRAHLESAGFAVQTADDVARSAVLLMADTSRHGQSIFSIDGKFSEVEEAMLEANLRIMGLDGPVEDPKTAAALNKMRVAAREAAGQN